MKENKQRQNQLPLQACHRTARNKELGPSRTKVPRPRAGSGPRRPPATCASSVLPRVLPRDCPMSFPRPRLFVFVALAGVSSWSIFLGFLFNSVFLSFFLSIPLPPSFLPFFPRFPLYLCSPLPSAFPTLPQCSSSPPSSIPSPFSSTIRLQVSSLENNFAVSVE